MRRNASAWQYWMGSLWGVVGLLTVIPPSHGESSASTTRIYECRVNGQRVFSDQSCAVDAAQRDITVQNSVSARDALVDYRPATSTQTKRKSTPEPEGKEKRLKRCAALQEQKGSLISRLRAGYNAKQGEHLRDRLRKVDGEYYDLRCSALH